MYLLTSYGAEVNAGTCQHFDVACNLFDQLVEQGEAGGLVAVHLEHIVIDGKRTMLRHWLAGDSSTKH